MWERRDWWKVDGRIKFQRALNGVIKKKRIRVLQVSEIMLFDKKRVVNIQITSIKHYLSVGDFGFSRMLLRSLGKI